MKSFQPDTFITEHRSSLQTFDYGSSMVEYNDYFNQLTNIISYPLIELIFSTFLVLSLAPSAVMYDEK